jgi:hypothetical protein
MTGGYSAATTGPARVAERDWRAVLRGIAGIAVYDAIALRRGIAFFDQVVDGQCRSCRAVRP